MPWFYTVGSEQRGPVEDAEFDSLIAAGTIRPDTYVWQPGMSNWEPLATVRPLAAQPAPPPPIPPRPVQQPEPVQPAIQPQQPAVYATVPAAAPLNFGPTSVGRLAGFWIRFLARLIDGLILGIPMSIIMGALFFGLFATSYRPGYGFDNDISPFAIGGMVIFVVLGSVLLQVAYEYFMLSSQEATIGKRALGLKVVSLQGQRLDQNQLRMRVALYPGVVLLQIIPLVGMLVMLYLLADAIVLGTDARKQSLHDRIAKTLVVYR